MKITTTWMTFCLLALPLGAIAQEANPACVEASSTCVTGGCQTFTTQDGTGQCVCATGTTTVPSGCIVDDSAACWDTRNTYSCANPAGQCDTDAGCNLTGQTCMSYNADGQCDQWQQTYQCSKVVKTCTATQVLNSCTAINTGGYENQPTESDPNGPGQALAALAVLDAINKGLSGSMPPTIFDGSFSHCSQQKACGNLGHECCCDTTLHRGISIAGCNDSEVALSGDRRAGLAHELSYCCAHSVSLGPFGSTCLSHHDNFCVFSSMLARLIQEQGRQQLAASAAKSAQPSAQVAVSFSLYGSAAGSGSPQGQWLGPWSVAGNDVWVYQWPYTPCVSNPDTGASSSSSGGTAQPGSAAYAQPWCPQTTGEVWWAACDGAGCSAPDQIPPKYPSDTQLQLTSTDNGSPQSVALSKFVVETGNCGAGDATATCTFTLSAQPISAGSAPVSSDLDWPLYGGAGWDPPSTIGVKYEIAPYSMDSSQAPALGGPAPTSVAVEYAATINSTGGTGTWKSQSIPLSIPATSAVSLTGSSLVIYGECPAPDYQCAYHVSDTNAVLQKPWGGACKDDDGNITTPDCSGFSIQQFMLLDISKMDLSEWTASISPPANPDATALSSSATSSAQAMASAPQTGTPQTLGYDRSGMGGTAIQLSRGDCQTGINCTITADMVSQWPPNAPATPGSDAGPVASVDLNWGDGSPSVNISTTTTVNGQSLFEAQHSFANPGNYTVTAVFNMSDGQTHQAQATEQAWYDTPPTDTTHNSRKGGAEFLH